MAYRLEKEPNGKEAIVITFPNTGIAEDPYSGMNRLYTVNTTVPNEVSVGYNMTNSTTSGGTLGAPIARSTAWFASYTSATGNGSPSKFAMLDDTGQVWEATTITGTWTFLSSSNSTTGSSSADGLAYYLGYLFKFRNSSIDIWNGSSWYKVGWNTVTGGAGVTSITGGVKHYAYVASDNTLYFTNGNYLGAIGLANPSSPSSFDPATPATYTFSATKLQLPQSDWAVSIGEVGGGNTPQSTLLVGGLQNAIYPWDKTSSSFNYPIFMADSYAANIVSANQSAFIFAGKNSGRGRIFITNGAQAEVYFKMPDYIFGQQDPYYTWGDAIFHRNNLIFGTFVIPNTTSSPLPVNQVWALDLATKEFRSIAEVSTVTLAGNATCLISPVNLSTPGMGFIMGSSDGGSNFKISYSGTTAGTGFAGIITDLMPVGTFMQKKTFSQVEVKFRNALQAGESVTVIPIADGASTTTLTFSPALSNGVLSSVAPVTFQASQWLQFQLSMTGASATSGCRLYEIRVR